MSRNLGRKLAAGAVAASLSTWVIAAHAQSLVTIGIGTQDTTTNTVTAGVIIRQLHLLEKYLPKDGRYASVKFQIDWNNFTSGPPVTNTMIAMKTTMRAITSALDRRRRSPGRSRRPTRCGCR